VLLALEALRLCPHVERRIILAWKPLRLHLWRGNEFVNAADRVVVAACNRSLNDVFANAARGDWDVASSARVGRCSNCEKHARNFPETRALPERGLTRELEARLQSALLTDVKNSVIDLASRRALGAAAVLDIHGYPRRTNAAAVILLHEDREDACIRILRFYASLRRRRSQGDLHGLLSTDDWQELVDDAFELANAGTLPAAAVIDEVDDRPAAIVERYL
jgi:hypothetical protein